MEKKMTKEQQELIQELDKAKAAKDSKLQRKLRKLLRESGYFISKGGAVDQDTMKEWEEKKKKRAEKRRQLRSYKKKAEKAKADKPSPEESVRNWFEFDEDTNWEDIQKQYKALCKENHPDKGGDTEHMKEINEAYEILKAYFGK